MTELVSNDVNDTTANFILKRYPGFPEADIRLRVEFMDNSVRLVGGFCEPARDGPCYKLDTIAVTEGYRDMKK